MEYTLVWDSDGLRFKSWLYHLLINSINFWTSVAFKTWLLKPASWSSPVDWGGKNLVNNCKNKAKWMLHPDEELGRPCPPLGHHAGNAVCQLAPRSLNCQAQASVGAAVGAEDVFADHIPAVLLQLWLPNPATILMSKPASKSHSRSLTIKSPFQSPYSIVQTHETAMKKCAICFLFL